MKRLFFLCTLFLLFTISSCSKENSVRGRIYNQLTGSGLEDVPFRLGVYRKNSENATDWFYNSSGVDGYFNLKSKSSKKDIAQLRIEIDTFKYYLFFNQKIDFTTLPENTILNLEVLRKNHVEFHLKNNSGHSNSRDFRFDLKFIHEQIGEIGTYKVYNSFGSITNGEGFSRVINLVEGKVTVIGSYTIDDGPAIPVNQSYIIKGETNKIQMLELGV